MKESKIILTHEMVRIVQTTTGYDLHLCMQNGQWVEHEPFPPDQRGLVAAVSLAAEILAGKFWLRKTLQQGPALNIPTPMQLSSK
jgi:hypothetical protein